MILYIDHPKALFAPLAMLISPKKADELDGDFLINRLSRQTSTQAIEGGASVK